MMGFVEFFFGTKNFPFGNETEEETISEMKCIDEKLEAQRRTHMAPAPNVSKRKPWNASYPANADISSIIAMDTASTDHGPGDTSSHDCGCDGGCDCGGGCD